MSVFIIAEAGVNHNGELKKAHQLIDIAANAGADAVKFQTINPIFLSTAGPTTKGPIPKANSLNLIEAC